MSAPLLNVDSGGAPHVLGYVEQPAGSMQRAPLEEQILSGTAWSGSTVEGAFATYGFEIDLADRSLVEARTDTTEIVLATRDGATWSQTPLSAQDPGTLALDVGGAPIFYLADGTTLTVYDAAGTTLFTLPVAQGTYSSVPGHVAFAASQPKPIAAGSAELAFALLGADGLHVLLADGAGAAPVDVPIPTTAPPAVPCTNTATGSLNTGQSGAECAADCTFTGSGLAPSGAFSLARTADGALFLAYVIADYDSTYQYTWHTGETNLTCMSDGPSGGWSSTLHVVRIAPDGGSLTEALSAAVGRSDGGRLEPISNSWAVAARAFGQRVAVGVAGRPATGLAGVRVTAFDAVP